MDDAKIFDRNAYGSLGRDEQLNFLSSNQTIIFVPGNKIMKKCNYSNIGVRDVPCYVNYEQGTTGAMMFGKFKRYVNSSSDTRSVDKGRCPAIHYFLVDFRASAAEIAQAKQEAETYPDRCMIAVEVFQTPTGDVQVEAIDVIEMNEYQKLGKDVTSRDFINTKAMFK